MTFQKVFESHLRSSKSGERQFFQERLKLMTNLKLSSRVVNLFGCNRNQYLDRKKGQIQKSHTVLHAYTWCPGSILLTQYQTSCSWRETRMWKYPRTWDGVPRDRCFSMFWVVFSLYSFPFIFPDSYWACSCALQLSFPIIWKQMGSTFLAQVNGRQQCNVVSQCI